MSIGLLRDTVVLEPHQQEWDIPGQHLYRCGDLDNGIVTHFIHVVIADSDAWHNYINFRDYMNAHEEDAKIYEALKIRLWKEFPDDRDSYVNGKHELITDYLQKAREWRKRYVGEAD